MSKLQPREAVPPLTVPTVAGGTWTLGANAPANFTLVVFYRGLHCPLCGLYLKDLDSKLAAFAERGVDVIAISSDGSERAAEAKAKWGLNNLAIGHSLSLDKAAAWGLYVSAGIGTTSSGYVEPDKFSEPGLFLIRADGTLYYGAVQTMPFARPAFGDLLKALDFAIDRNYPARGELRHAA